MATILSQLHDLTTVGWRVTHLIWLDTEWQCNITDGDHIAIGTGLDPEDACANASLKALHGSFAERFSLREHMDQSERPLIVDLREVLGLRLRRQPIINRRI